MKAAVYAYAYNANIQKYFAEIKKMHNKKQMGGQAICGIYLYIYTGLSYYD